MANLRTPMDSSFYDLDVASPLNLNGTAKSVPGDSIPLDGTRAGKVVRVHQLLVMQRGFPYGLVPSFASPMVANEAGSFSVEKLLARPTFAHGWLGLIGKFRPKKLVSSVKDDATGVKDVGLPVLKDMAKRIFDKSLYSLGLCSDVYINGSSSIMLSTECDGERKKCRTKARYFQEFPRHDLTIEAAWPELFVDRNGGYWDIPGSLSLNLSSLSPRPGLRYRFGLHRNSGPPEAMNFAAVDPVPQALSSGVIANAAVSFEKCHDFWRRKERNEDTAVKTEKGWFWRLPYDERLKEPHSAISGVIGGNFVAAFGGNGGAPRTTNSDSIAISSSRSSVSADMFGSVCYTLQHGQFRENYGDLTRLDARIDVNSATALLKKVFNASEHSPVNASPRLNLIFQQQLAGPIAFRVDSKYAIDSSLLKSKPEDVIYSLTYSLKLLSSGKVVAWYSPKRKEGMIELRAFEF